MMKNFSLKPVIILLIVCIIFGVFVWWMQKSSISPTEQTINIDYHTDQRVAFIENSYQLIKDNYWQTIPDQELTDLFLQAISRVYGAQAELKNKTRQGLTEAVNKLIKDLPSADHAELLAQVVDLVLQNLQPLGRSRLYQAKDKDALQNTVSNIDPQTDLFAVLGVDINASDAAIESAYEEKVIQIRQNATDEQQQAEQLAQAERAKQALGNEENRTRYQQTKIEPTVNTKLLTGNILYLDWSKFSPTSIEDFQRSLKELSTNHQINGLILDLRGNVGGAIDALPYLLGPFLGKNQYAYQFFSHGETLDFKTKFDKFSELTAIKRMVILIDDQTQSSAEVMAASLKKYHIGVLVGTKTKGWGTVERVFSLDHQPDDQKKMSLFLVHSLTLDETGQPIEGRGVMPDVDVTQADWQAELKGYFADEQMVKAVREYL